MFQFKQFAVDQAGCAMKINTDGVLLGALAQADEPRLVLDIGTGTGVIALMLAQRFPDAKIDAVEIDHDAATTAARNFKASKFTERLSGYHIGFEDYFKTNEHLKYDLIVTNPPFYIQSLPSPGAAKAQAKHTNSTFLQQLVSYCAAHLKVNGSLWLVMPGDTAIVVKQFAAEYQLYLQHIIYLQSYPNSSPHRQILAFGVTQTETTEKRLIIYDEPKVYSQGYQVLLKDFLTIF